ncbi:MAG: hypothetical protein ACI358_02535 [Candidatus Limimorpha sp.]
MRKEILKYLGYTTDSIVDDKVMSLVDKAVNEVGNQSCFRYIFKKFDSPLPFMNEVSAYHDYLKGAPFLLCASTLGVQIDRYLQRLQLRDMAYAAIFDAAANAFLEHSSDEFEKNLDMPLDFRFCPGYSGTPFSDNRVIAKALKAENIGITFLDSGLMVPLKSMMGIVRIGEKRVKNCFECVAKDSCRFRDNGTFCYKIE